MQEYYIETPDQLVQFCNQIQHSQWLAIDTEFVREKTYYSQFCLLQVSNGEHAACIDPLALDDLSPITELLYREDIVKVLHAAHQDMEIFFHLYGKVPAPLFDTQLAGAITGYGDQLGYARLVQQVLGLTLEKDQARTDWSRRPLDQAQRRYALNDVIHLGEIYQQLRDRLQKLGRTDWLDADHQTLAKPSTYQVLPEQAWKKVKGRQHLKGVQYAVLQKVAAWRETRAVNSDRPRRWILKDEVVIDIARRMPTKTTQLAKIRGLEAGQLNKIGDTLLQLVQQGRDLPQEQWPSEKMPTQRLNQQQEALVDLLMTCLRLLGAKHEITAAAIATRKELEKLVTGADSELLNGWRYKIAGQPLQAVLNGQLLPGWSPDGELTLLPVSANA